MEGTSKQEASDPFNQLNFVLYGVAAAAVMLGVVSIFLLPSEVTDAPWPIVAVFVALQALFVVGAKHFRVQLDPAKTPYLGQLRQRTVMTAAVAEFPVLLSFMLSMVFVDHAMVTVATAATLILGVPTLRVTDATITAIDRHLQAKGVMSGIGDELQLQ